MNEGAFYGRVSHPAQVKKGQSLPNQLEKMLAKAKAVGIDIPERHIYLEKGITGANDDRPEYNRLLAAILDGKIKALFTYDISRLTRTNSREEQGRIIRILAEAGCDLYTDGAHYDLTNPQSRFVFGINAEVSLYDNALRAQKSYEGKVSTRKSGKNPGQAPAAGYLKYYYPDGRLAYRLDEKLAAPGKLAYEMALRGSGGTRILQELSRRGYKTKTGKPLSLSHVYQWLQNPTYAGYVHVGISRGSKAKEKGMWPADFIEGTLVTLEEWEKVQQLLNFRKTGKAPTRFPLSGILTCPSCGEFMIGTYKRGGKIPKVRYYACLPSANNPDHICPNTQGRSIMMSVAHQLVIQALPEIINHLGGTYETRMLAYQAQLLQMDEEIDEKAHLEKELASIERKILTNIQENENAPSDYFRSRIRELDAEAKAIKAKIKSLEKMPIIHPMQDPRALLDLLPHLDPGDMQILDEVIRPLFTKVNYSRSGTHRKYTYKLSSVTFKWGENLRLEKVPAFSQK